MKNDKSQKTQTTVKTLIILGILIVINVISIRMFGRLDLTENNLYTLSDASKELISNLDDRIVIKAYFTEELPAPYNQVRRQLVDMLNEYRAYAGDRLTYEFIDPKSEDAEKVAQEAGVPPVEVQVVEEDKVEVKKAYMGLVIRYLDKKEVIPIVQNLSSLEYDLSSKFKRLAVDEKKTIGYASGHGETDLLDLRIASEAIQEQYDLQSVDLTLETEIPDKFDVFLIIDPQEQFSDTAKYAIDQYIMNGGKAGILTGKVKIDPTLQNPSGRLADLGIDDLLANYGIKINDDLIKDARAATIMVSRQQGQYQIRNQIQFPFLPIVTNFDEDNIITSDLDQVILPFTSSIDTSLASDLNIDADVLAVSSEASGRQTERLMIDPFYQWSELDFRDEYIPLAAVFSGQFRTFFSGSGGLTSEKKTSPETRIIVVGTGQFIQDNYLQQARENLVFFENIVDYLADDSGLISIRSKNLTQPPLENIDSGARNLLKYGNMVIPPLLIILYGIYRWRRRKSYKKSIEESI